MATSKRGKLSTLVNYKMRVTLQEPGRMLVGTMMAFDKHMNLVLSDCVEVRRVNRGGEERDEKRALGLVLLRGENIVSVCVDGPPPLADRNTFRRPPHGATSLGAGVPAGRGVGAPQIIGAPQGLAAPVRGVGGAGHNMAPSFGAPPPFFGGAPPMPGFAPPPGGFAPPPGGFAPPAGFVPGMFPPGMPPGGFAPPPGFGVQPPPGGMNFPPGMGPPPTGINPPPGFRPQ